MDELANERMNPLRDVLIPGSLLETLDASRLGLDTKEISFQLGLGIVVGIVKIARYFSLVLSPVTCSYQSR